MGQDFAAWYFDGHFVIIDPGVVDEGPVRVPSAGDHDVAAGAEEVGHRALVEDRHVLLVRALDVAEHEAHAGAVRVAGRRADHTARERDLAGLRRQLAR